MPTEPLNKPMVFRYQYITDGCDSSKGYDGKEDEYLKCHNVCCVVRHSSARSHFILSPPIIILFYSTNHHLCSGKSAAAATAVIIVAVSFNRIELGRWLMMAGSSYVHLYIRHRHIPKTKAISPFSSLSSFSAFFSSFSFFVPSDTHFAHPFPVAETSDRAYGVFIRTPSLFTSL